MCIHWTYFSFPPVNSITSQFYNSSLRCCFFSIIPDHKTRVYMQRTVWSGIPSWISALKISNMHIIAVSAIISWFHAPCESVLLYKVQREFRRSCIICAELIDEGIVFLYFLLSKKKSKSENKQKEKRKALQTCCFVLLIELLSKQRYLEHNAELRFNSTRGRLFKRWIQNNRLAGEHRTSSTRS